MFYGWKRENITSWSSGRAGSGAPKGRIASSGNRSIETKLAGISGTQMHVQLCTLVAIVGIQPLQCIVPFPASGSSQAHVSTIFDREHYGRKESRVGALLHLVMMDGTKRRSKNVHSLVLSTWATGKAVPNQLLGANTALHRDPAIPARTTIEETTWAEENLGRIRTLTNLQG